MNTDQNNGSAEQKKLIHEALTEQIIGAAMEVHKALGPGLLESVYEECLCYELHLRGLRFQRQVTVPVIYKGVSLDCGYRLDLIVEHTVILELKCVERVLAIHEAQLMTYLKLLDKPVGFIMNFNVPVLRQGLTRKVFDSASPRLRGEKSFIAGAGSKDGR
ncbi:MAG TPA: GxxExxY protein [Candidatus Angelobacter sp.]|nr:GxxExxY protein [Candidatus Angelobacter sp.]